MGRLSLGTFIKEPILWLAIIVALLFVVLTGIYQLEKLSGQAAITIFTLGELTVIPFILSIIFSIIVCVSRRNKPYFYLSLIINILTFAFLYWAWFMTSPTQQYLINENSTMFYRHVGKSLPSGISNIKEFDTTSGSFLGDGDSELSFNLEKTVLEQWMVQTRFQWKSGPFKKAGDTLNEFTNNGSLLFKDSPDIQYVVIDRTPANLKRSPDDISDSTTIFVNQTEGWVLIQDHDI